MMTKLDCPKIDLLEPMLFLEAPAKLTAIPNHAKNSTAQFIEHVYSPLAWFGDIQGQGVQIQN